jgi:hypothetical protein
VSIAVTPAAASIPLGTTQAYDAVGTYTDGTTQDVTQVGHWSSSNAVAATISNTPGSQGLASTLGTGTTTITIAVGTVSGTATLTVNPAALLTITVNPQTPTIALGTTQQFTASGTYTDGSVQDLTGTAQWSSSSATVAVMSTTGLATSAGTGTATITATQGTLTASTTLTVGQAAIISLAVSPTASTIPLGTTQQFTAIATYTDGTTQDLTASASWSSSVPGVAAVNATGLANSLSAGTTTISANAGGASGGSILTVTTAVPVSLAVTPVSASIAFGAQQQFQAFLTYSDGSVQNVTSLVVWSSSVPATATITNTGLATGAGAGSSNIYASATNGMNAAGALTVGLPPAGAVLTTPAPGSTLSSRVATFRWMVASGASAYSLSVGSTPGGTQYYQSGNLGNALTAVVSTLPANGSTIYVTLYSLFGVEWSGNSYTYTSVSTKALDFGPPPSTGANCGLTTPTWTTGHLYLAKSWVQPNPANGHFYRTGATGTSGAVQPTWNTGSGSTTTDNGIPWIEQGTNNLKQCPDDVSLYVYRSGQLDGVTIVLAWSTLESSNSGCTAHASYNFLTQMDPVINAVLNDSNFPATATVAIVLSGISTGTGPNNSTPCYVFSSAYAKSLATSTMPVGFCTTSANLGAAYPGSGKHASSNAVFTDGLDTTGYPWTPSVPYSTAWEAFQDAAIAHINASSYAGRVSYERIGIFQDGEAFPHCLTLFKNYLGESEAAIKTTVTGFANALYTHEASQSPSYPLMAGVDGNCVDAVKSCGVGYGWADSEAASAVAAFPSGGFGSQGLTESDIAAFNSYGYADGGVAINPGTYCTGNYCYLFHEYPTQPVLELQMLAATCPQGLNQCGSGTQQSQTGTLVNILPFVTLMKTTHVELYNQDWLCAFDPNYLPCAGYASAYVTAIANVRAENQ